ncbi:MAG: hypothetical protein AAF219_00965 [Myxococcota bacterium]
MRFSDMLLPLSLIVTLTHCGMVKDLRSSAVASSETPIAGPTPIETGFPSIPANLRATPADDVPAIALERVSWCSADVKPLDWSESRIENRYERAIKNLTRTATLADVGRFACSDPASSERLTWVRSYMQAYANATGMPETHQAKVIAELVKLSSLELRDFDNTAPESCSNFEADQRANHVVAEATGLKLIGLACADPMLARFALWWVDREPKLDSQLQTMGWLYASFGYTAKVAPFQSGVVALMDAKTLDLRAFEQELDALGVDQTVRAKALLRAYETKTAIGKWSEHHRDSLGEETFGALTNTFDQAIDAWTNDYKDNREAVDFAWQMEELVAEGDKGQLAGCSEKAREYASQFLASRTPKSKEDVSAAAADPIGTLLVASAYECENALDNALAAQTYASLLEEGPAARGPRFAGLLAVARKTAELKQTITRLPLETRDFRPYVPNSAFGMPGTRYFEDGAGIVAKVSNNGDAMSITFKKDRWKIPKTQCRETNRVDRILPDGTVRYRKICKQVGEVTVTRKEEPVTIPTRAAHGVKPGAFMYFLRDKEQSSQGVPKEVYTSKRRGKLINYYGLSLK